MELLTLLWGTVLLRPYVFVFLAVYLTIAILNMGVVRSIAFTLLAYIIAFMSEYSSTRNGFPYGFYSYIETTRDQELWISNVPFMDSLSFTFLAYVAYTMALFLWSPLKKDGWDIRLQDSEPARRSLKVVFSGAVLFMLMDVIIDPVAFQGDRWFLGKIYTYKEQGEYFNIPLTNFFGWLVVGTAILFSFTRLDGWLTRNFSHKPREVPAQALLGPGLYFGVLLFNLAVTFYIGEWVLGACGVGLTLALSWLIYYKIQNPEKITL
ncbi:MAG: carotenoid biosynthesis protein [Nitrospinaceae bacterium]|jgi:putative membrane protein|nr:carotenoid biosynthesis protein [Nitrospinaceae bacterium]|tara:strand:+ start:2448 stop:3242 length:795 start_codon:yes stop_codon:yes gene_type:complete